MRTPLRRSDWHQGSWCDRLAWTPPSLPGALLTIQATPLPRRSQPPQPQPPSLAILGR
jgi:hypothetical protein